MKVDKTGKQRNQIRGAISIEQDKEKDSKKLVEIVDSTVLDGLKVGKRRGITNHS